MITKYSKLTIILTLIVGALSILGYTVKTNIVIPIDTKNIENIVPSIFIILSVIGAFLVGIQSLGKEKTISLLIITFIIAFIFELSSTYNGFPYGKYKYTDILLPKLLGEVPLLIPLSWFSIIVPSYIIASKLKTKGIERILVASILVLIWDLSLEYPMSYIQKIWIWENGFFYTMPIENWFGWFLTAFVIFGIFQLLFNDEKIEYTPNAIYLYLVITLFSSVFSIFTGGILPGLFTLGGILVIFLKSRIIGEKLW